jgi:hypothetical protein
MGIRSLLVLIGLSVIGLATGAPHPLRVACGSVLALYVPGLAVMLLLGDRHAPAADDVFMPPLYSVTALSLLVLAVYPITRSLGPAVFLSLLIALVLLVLALFIRRRALAPPARAPLPAAALLVPLVFGGIVGGLHLLNPYLIVRSDTLLHAPIVGEILDHGIPPMDPLLPAAPIQYMWFYHVGVASLVVLTGLSVLNALALLNLMTAVLFPYLVARITAHFTNSRLRIAAASALAVVGVGAASWIVWPICLLKTIQGEVRGSAAMALIVDSIHLNDSRVISFLRPAWTELVSIPDRFLTISGFQYGIDLVLLALLLVLNRDAQKRAPLAAAVTLTFAIAGAFLSHVVAGPVLIAVMLGTSGLLLLGWRLRLWERPPGFLTLALPAAGLVVALLCWPYLKSLTSGDRQALHLTRYLYFGVTNILTLIAPMVGLFFIVRPLLRRLVDVRTLENRILLAWLATLLFLNLFVTTPNQQSRKFALLFLTLLAVPLSLALADTLAALPRARRTLPLLWLLVLLGAPTALTVRGFLLERPGTIALKNAYQPRGDCAALYRWVSATAPATAVVTEPNPESLTPLYTHRHALMPHPGLQWLSSGTPLQGYATLHRELFADGPLAEATVERASALGCELYVVVWADDPPHLGRQFESRAPLFQKVYENSAGAVYRFDPIAARATRARTSPLAGSQGIRPTGPAPAARMRTTRRAGPADLLAQTQGEAAAPD